MNIVVYRKLDGKVKSLKTLPEGYDPSDYEDDIYSVLEVDELPSSDSKVIDGQVLPIELGDYPEESLKKAWFELRQKRSNLLNSSDWTQMKDNPQVSNTEWVDYRQALRDITDQQGAPFDVVWPEAPVN